MFTYFEQKQSLGHFFMLATILLIALFMRVWNIESAPPGLYPDEANNETITAERVSISI